MIKLGLIAAGITGLLISTAMAAQPVGAGVKWGKVKQEVEASLDADLTIDAPAPQSGYVTNGDAESGELEWNGTFYQTDEQKNTDLVSRDLEGSASESFTKEIKGKGKGNQGDGTNLKTETVTVDVTVVVDTKDDSVVSVTPNE